MACSLCGTQWCECPEGEKLRAREEFVSSERRRVQGGRDGRRPPGAIRAGEEE